jgi:hypothetical protein
MPSHLSDIGFALKTHEDFEQLAVKTCNQGQRFRTTDGSYIRWSPGLGIELWAQLDQHDEIIGLHPHFRGNARMRVNIINESRDRIQQSWTRHITSRHSGASAVSRDNVLVSRACA